MNEIIRWWTQVYNPQAPSPDTENWRKSLFDNFKHIRIGGWNPDTNQVVISLKCNNDDTEVQYEELRLWLEAIKPSYCVSMGFEKEKPFKYVGLATNVIIS